MAAIDKIYVTKPQFLLLKEWYDIMKEEELMPDYIPFDQYHLEYETWNDGSTAPVWNLSVKGDLWLLSNCPFNFVKKNILSNLGLD